MIYSGLKAHILISLCWLNEKLDLLAWSLGWYNSKWRIHWRCQRDLITSKWSPMLVFVAGDDHDIQKQATFACIYFVFIIIFTVCGKDTNLHQIDHFIDTFQASGWLRSWMIIWLIENRNKSNNLTTIRNNLKKQQSRHHGIDLRLLGHRGRSPCDISTGTVILRNN